MQDLRVAEIRTLTDLGGTFLEVSGKLVMRHGRRLYDQANHPDPMMDLEEASVRFHTRGASSPWQGAPGLTVNRDQVLLLAPRDPADAGAPSIPGQPRDVVLNLICGPLQVGGSVRVPFDASVSGYIHQSRSRFIAVARPRIRATQGEIGLGDFHDGVQLCLVNRAWISASVEARPRA